MITPILLEIPPVPGEKFKKPNMYKSREYRLNLARNLLIFWFTIPLVIMNIRIKNSKKLPICKIYSQISGPYSGNKKRVFAPFLFAIYKPFVPKLVQFIK
nr:hypothetical protein [Heyndrickxia coagulans]